MRCRQCPLRDNTARGVGGVSGVGGVGARCSRHISSSISSARDVGSRLRVHWARGARGASIQRGVLSSSGGCIDRHSSRCRLRWRQQRGADFVVGRCFGSRRRRSSSGKSCIRGCDSSSSGAGDDELLGGVARAVAAAVRRVEADRAEGLVALLRGASERMSTKSAEH